MDKNFEMYHRLSHELAFKQLVERFSFECAMNRDVFHEDITLMQLKNDCRNSENFSDEEYVLAYQKGLENMSAFKFEKIE